MRQGGEASSHGAGEPLWQRPVPHWPGQLVELPTRQLFVRHAPAVAGAYVVEPALFIHGLGGSSTNWTDLMDLLSRPVRARPEASVLDCFAVDLPGFGYSPPSSDDNYSISAHAGAVVELIERQGNWPVHLVGNSMGGAVATRVAARRPDLLRTLILVSPALPDLRPRLLPIRLALIVSPGIAPAAMKRLRRLPPARRTDRSVRDLFREPMRMHPARRAEEISEVQRRDGLDYANDALIKSARGLVNEYFAVGPTSLWRDAARTFAPVLVLHGSHDRLVNPALAAKAARRFRRARVVVLPGVGHVAMMERPAVVAQEIRAFLYWSRGARVLVSSAPDSEDLRLRPLVVRASGQSQSDQRDHS